GAHTPDERAAEALVPEVELELLVRALRHERRQRMRDRMEPLHREPGRDADPRLFHDADVDHTIWMRGHRPLEVRRADLGEHDRDPLIVLDQIRDGRAERLPHVAHPHSPSGTSATTAVGTSSCRTPNARSSASWSCPSTTCTSHP